MPITVLRSKKTCTERSPLTNVILRAFVTLTNAVSMLWCLKPDLKFSYKLLLCRKSHSWLATVFEKKGKVDRVYSWLKHLDQLLAFFFLFFKKLFNYIFFGLFLALLTGQLKSVTGNRVREGEWHAAKGPGPGVEPGSAAESRHRGHTCYQPS